MSHDEPQPREFPTALRGYATGDVDEFIDELEGRLAAVEQERDDLARQRDALERELARVRGELDATRAALPELESLHHRLEEVREEYGRRVHALELLMAAAAREVGERLSGARANGSPTPPTEQRTPADAATTDEIPAVTAEDGPDVLRGTWSGTPAEPEDA